MAIDYHIS